MLSVTFSDLNRSKCCVPPHPLGLHGWQRLLHGCGSWVLQNLRTCCNTSSLITGSLTGMGKNQAQKLSADVHIFYVPFFISSSCHFEHVLTATKKSPRNKSSLSSASQYVGKEKRADYTLEVRLLPDHYSHSFLEAGLISLQALIQENCLEKISGPRLQHLVSWQIQLSPWRHHANDTTLLSVRLSVLMLDLNIEMWLENPWLLRESLESKMGICDSWSGGMFWLQYRCLMPHWPTLEKIVI